ncbi:MAG: LysM peptidoglycan-binding domain-containing protein [Anaerolineales bacterium]
MTSKQLAPTWPVLALALAGLGLGAAPASFVLLQPTAFATPTPNPEGDIVYVVQLGDSPWRIAAIAGITVEELMALNGIESGDFISPGMELLLGSVAPIATPAASPTPTLSPEEMTGTGEICVLLFLDQNGNARLDETELALADGQVSVADRQGNLAGDHTTGTEPEGFCFTELEAADYNVSGAVPPNYNPTTSMNVPVRLEPGDIKFVQFGGQPSGAIATVPRPEGSGSSLLGAIGLAMLGGAGLLGYLAFRTGRQT